MRGGGIELKIDFDILKEELSTLLIDDKQERYQMTWPDKKKTIHLANSRTTATLRLLKKNHSILTIHKIFISRGIT